MEIKNIGQLIQHLATKSGIDPNDKNLINLLSNSELTKQPVHSDFVKAIDENLLSIDAATDNHPLIGSKYKAQALNAFDKKMLQIMDELELDEDDKAALTGIQSSYKRFETLAAKIKELNAAKANATDKSDKAALQKQIDELQKQLKAATESVAAKEAEFGTKLNDVKTDYLFKSKLAGKKTIFDQLPEDLRHSSVMAAISKALQEKDAKVVYDEKGNPTLQKSDGSKLYGANHTLITLDDLIDTSLAQNKILVVAEPPKGAQQQQANGTIIPGGNQTAIGGTNQSVVDFNLSQLQGAAN